MPVGKIDLLKSFSFFEVEERFSDTVIGTLNNTRFKNRKVAIEVAQEKSGKKEQGNFFRKRVTGKFDQRPEKRTGREEKGRNKYKKNT